MKITKSELREMIREALREELMTRRSLKEAAQRGAKQLYVAINLNGGDLIGAVWATSDADASTFFSNSYPLPAPLDDIYIETLEDSGYTLEELAEEDDSILNGDGGFILNMPYVESKIKERAAGAGSVIVRCANAVYEDDDGCIRNVGIYAGNATFEELTNILYDQGMMYVDVYDEYESDIPATAKYKLGDVVDVFEADDEFITDFANENGLDPNDYLQSPSRSRYF